MVLPINIFLRIFKKTSRKSYQLYVCFVEEREGFPCQLSTPLHHQMPTTPFEGLKVDRDRINIISEIPLERLPQFDMFEGKCTTRSH